jgi:la-related protein 1
MAAAAVPFSYAQAAKGLTSPNPSAPSGAITTAKENLNSPVIDSAACESSKSVGSIEPKQKTIDTPAPALQTESSIAEVVASKLNAEYNGTNSPPNMSYIDSSISTLHREDDASSNPNASSSESTWENISQTSNTADKSADSSDRTVKGGRTENENGWVKVPKPTQEAPVPAVNVWKQRLEAASKSTKKSPVLGQDTSAGPFAKPMLVVDGSEKKADRSAPGRAKEHKREQRLDDDSNKSRRTGRKPADEKAPAPPPSIRDATLWPTPETTAQDSLKKSTEKNDLAEAAKSAGKAKTEWKKVEVNHSVLFSTPLPNAHSRRGGRGGGRGGRDGGNSRSSPPGSRHAGSLLERAPGDGPTDLTRRENGARANSPSRGKRAVSDDVPARRDSRPVGVPAKEVSPKEPVIGDAQPRQPSQEERGAVTGTPSTIPRHGAPTKAGRKPDGGFEFDQTKEGKSRELPNGEGPAESASSIAGRPAPTNEEDRKPVVDNAASRFATRGSHANPYANNRRTSLRGRGNGHHGYHAPNTPHGGFQHPNGFGARSPPISNDPSWGHNQHAGRNFRGPRSQAASADAYARYPNGFPTAGPLPVLNTFMGQPSVYDYPHAMTAIPYTPMLDPYNMVGMVALQL